ncbi:MAG: outer membrane protein assembly factor BamE [Pseudomonas sp.]|nr:outer membrane protein assembly factor BamE [Pseudomonas sp.]
MPLRVVALLAACLLLAACNKISQDNYAQLKPGMSKGDVEGLLGKPAECAGALGMSSCTWGDEQRFISVQYANDQVLMFSGKGLK